MTRSLSNISIAARMFTCGNRPAIKCGIITKDASGSTTWPSVPANWAFARVEVIDDDQGKTGSGMVERPGFADVAGGGVQRRSRCRVRSGSIAAGSQQSRLASLDRLVCADRNADHRRRRQSTIRVQVNDRLLFGLKGTMSEFELSLFRQRAREAFEMKVAAGHAMWEVPVGFTRDEQDRVEKIADRQVQAAIESVFAKVPRTGFGPADDVVVSRQQDAACRKSFVARGAAKIVWRLPSRIPHPPDLEEPVLRRCVGLRHAPKRRSVVDDGRARKSSTRTRKPQEKWKVLLLDNHDGYITWQEYQENLSMLEANASQREPTAGGAAKKGTALLGGLLRCSHCGRKLFVGYGRNRDAAALPVSRRSPIARQRVVPVAGRHGRRSRGQRRGARSDSAGGHRSRDRSDEAVRSRARRTSPLAGVVVGEGSLRSRSRATPVRSKSIRPIGSWRSELESRWNAALERAAELEQQLDAVDARASSS